MKARIIKNGHLYNDTENKLFYIKPYEKTQEKIIIPYATLKPSEWGYLYEKYVGQYFEEKGYSIEYVGLTKGFLDGGIDLIARANNKSYFIQCKYQIKNKLSKSKVENILHKAGNTISKMEHSRNDVFALVVPNKDSVFRKIKLTSNSLIAKYEFPVYDYFLSKNDTQSQIKLEILEVLM